MNTYNKQAVLEMLKVYWHQVAHPPKTVARWCVSQKQGQAAQIGVLSRAGFYMQLFPAAQCCSPTPPIFADLRIKYHTLVFLL
jgi:hypothetical protein